MSLEHKLVSTLTDDPAAIARVFDMGLPGDVFEDTFYRQVYDYIIGYWQESKMLAAPSALVVETQAKYLRRPTFALDAEVEEEAWWLAGELKRRHLRNDLQETLIKGAEMAGEGPNGPAEAWNWLQGKAYAANEVMAPRNTRSDMSDFEGRRLRYTHREEGGEQGMALGLVELDEITGGVRPGEICTVGAYSKVGKTMFLLNAASWARKAGYQPIVFSLEMPVEEIEERLDALLSGVSYSRLSRHKLDPSEIDKLHAMQEALAEMGPLRIESPDEGERSVAHLCARARHTDSDYMLIDQLSFMEETRSYQTEKYRQASIMKELKNEVGRASLGKLACMLAAQFKRESLDRDDGPRIDDFADAAEVERTSHLLIGLSRNTQQRANRTMRADILAGRRCDAAKYLLYWDLIDRTHISVMERITR